MHFTGHISPRNLYISTTQKESPCASWILFPHPSDMQLNLLLYLYEGE